MAGLAAFAAAYLLLNRYILAESVLYRAAAYDYGNAAANMAMLSVQAGLLLAAIVLLPRRYALFAGLAALASAGINMVFGQILGEPVDLARTAWLMQEARQAGNAMGEFLSPFLKAVVKIALAAALLWLARFMLRPMATGFVPAWLQNPWLLVAALVLPSLVMTPWKISPQAAERNMYGYAVQVLLADPPPPRAAVQWEPDIAGTPDKIVWIIDESIGHTVYASLIAPELAAHRPLDFGEAAALGNCSTPANVALRSGVAVDTVGSETDLRRNPSIWGYARKAGYNTVMIDGQVDGPPQNQLLAPERALIDEYIAAASDMDTDREIAWRLNARLKSDGREFVYAVLRGVHFQYRDHYPPGTVPDDAPLRKSYEAAIAYSKDRFFDILLDGVDRDNVAIVYTSDHGQYIAKGTTPHCSLQPHRDEFSVPLAAFLPGDMAGRYAAAGRKGHSASQIFPATLGWMGYDSAGPSKRYDNDLSLPTRQYVWFGRAVTPAGEGEEIEVYRPSAFPGL